MFRNVEERKIMRAYKKYVKETGCDVSTLDNDIYLQQIDVHRRNDESAEKDEDQKAITCSLMCLASGFIVFAVAKAYDMFKI